MLVKGMTTLAFLLLKLSPLVVSMTRVNMLSAESFIQSAKHSNVSEYFWVNMVHT